MSTPRQPKGIPAGGRFAASERAEPSVALTPVDSRAFPGASGKRDLLGPGTLAERSPAWTPAAIKRFLGDADKEIRNPVFRNGPKMKMYSATRVEAVEATDEWADWEARSLRRIEAAALRNAETAPDEAKVELGHGRNGFYPVVRR